MKEILAEDNSSWIDGRWEKMQTWKRKSSYWQKLNNNILYSHVLPVTANVPQYAQNLILNDHTCCEPGKTKHQLEIREHQSACVNSEGKRLQLNHLIENIFYFRRHYELEHKNNIEEKDTRVNVIEVTVIWRSSQQKIFMNVMS